MPNKKIEIRYDDLDDFRVEPMTFEGKEKRVYVSGQGPAVIVMAEMPGIYEYVARFARYVRDAGFRVYMPDLFGTAGKPPEAMDFVKTFAKTCISREFRAFASNKSSPVVDWLRALARSAYEESGGRGVGAIGMCFTGNFAFNLMLEPSVLAPVMCQPSLPIGKAGGMHIASSELKCIKERLDQEDLSVLAYRFEGDRLCRSERFSDYEKALGDRFVAKVLPDEAAREETGMSPHSVVTMHLVDEEGEPTKDSVNEILEFYKHRLL